MTGRLKQLTRTQVRQVECPACGAQPGQLCIRERGGPRTQNHRERGLRARTQLPREALRPNPETATTPAQYALIGRLVAAREGVASAAEADRLIKRLGAEQEKPLTG